jgi:hypothetical protein
MTYTIKIDDNTLKAKSIINMLKALKDDYDFIEIKRDPKPKTKSVLDKELDKRYKAFLNNPTGKDWDELRKELL